VVERRSEEQSSRLEALPRSLPSGSQSCLICVDRTHSRRDRPGWPSMPVGCGGGARGVVAHGGEHNVGQSPFQAAQGFPFRLAGGPFAQLIPLCQPRRADGGRVGQLGSSWTASFSGAVLASGDQLSVSPLDRVDCVITGCAVALAEIGTLILDGSSRQGRRVLTLVPLLAVTQTRFVNVEVSVSL
jgi:hypothetical protein